MSHKYIWRVLNELQTDTKQSSDSFLLRNLISFEQPTFTPLRPFFALLLVESKRNGNVIISIQPWWCHIVTLNRQGELRHCMTVCGEHSTFMSCIMCMKHCMMHDSVWGPLVYWTRKPINSLFYQKTCFDISVDSL